MGHPRFFDFHCDTITREKGATPAASDFLFRPERGVTLTDNGFHIDLDRLPKEWDWAQVFAVFIPDEFRGQAAIDYFERCVAAFGEELERQKGLIGQGVHERFIVTDERFLAKAARKREG